MLERIQRRRDLSSHGDDPCCATDISLDARDKLDEPGKETIKIFFTVEQ
jgi:hypothetical protein